MTIKDSYKRIICNTIIIIGVICAYLIVGLLGVKYVWPDVKQQVIEILQEGRK